jgi:hypothetical protein
MHQGQTIAKPVWNDKSVFILISHWRFDISSRRPWRAITRVQTILDHAPNMDVASTKIAKRPWIDMKSQ